MAPVDAVRAVQSAAVAGERNRLLGRPDPSDEDLLDALLLVRGARDDVDYSELHLIGAARAAGVSWQRIGTALGYAEPAGRQGAVARYRRLRERWPGWKAPGEDGERDAPVTPLAHDEGLDDTTATAVAGEDDR